MMGTKARSLAPLCNRSLEDLVPVSHFYRHLEAKLDLASSAIWSEPPIAGLRAPTRAEQGSGSTVHSPPTGSTRPMAALVQVLIATGRLIIVITRVTSR
jgi:hypothetical protein